MLRALQILTFQQRLQGRQPTANRIPRHTVDVIRFGHFHYVVPVTTGSKYTLRLYFMEHWFGVQNGDIGGVGSRVFDVSCNGAMLL